VPQLDTLEVSAGVVYGPRRTPLEEAEHPPPSGKPREVLEEILLEALRRPPAVVAFSGGRDSSAILAEATRVARAHGLDDPVPFTLRFGEAPRTDETEWQEMVIRHLGLEDWSTRAVTDELDALGPIALGLLRRHGVHWPPNVHTFELLFEPAKGGSLVTGNGGDELFSAWGGHRHSLLRRGRALPRRSDFKPLLLPLLPMAFLARRPKYRIAWLRPDAALEVGRGMAAGLKGKVDRSWSESMESYLHSRYIEIALGTVGAMAATSDVRHVEPFFDPRYAREVCADAPPEGYPSRTVAMERNFADVLPPRLPGRLSKAMFTEVFTGPETRRFAGEWDGSGVDHSLVDPEALRAQWLSDRPDVRSLVPLQAAWLAKS
jgi:asparagine synthase (glutamine-hydrolysing)